MIKLYYTSKKGENELQTRPDLSLGGFKSSTLIPNNSVNNLFSDISLYTVYRNQDEIIGIIAKNEAETPLTNVKLWFEYPEETQRVLQVGAVDLTSEGYMEGIENAYSQPYYAEFFEADGEANAVDLGDFDAGQSVGLWFKASINKENIETSYSDESIETNGNPKQSTDEIKIIVEWD